MIRRTIFLLFCERSTSFSFSTSAYNNQLIEIISLLREEKKMNKKKQKQEAEGAKRKTGTRNNNESIKFLERQASSSSPSSSWLDENIHRMIPAILFDGVKMA